MAEEKPLGWNIFKQTHTSTYMQGFKKKSAYSYLHTYKKDTNSSRDCRQSILKNY